MARIRSVKPEYWDDRKLARCSRDARLLYIGLWNHADEWSRIFGDPRWIKGQVFPYDDDVDSAVISKWLDELESAGGVRPYEHEGDPYLFLPKLIKHQYLDPQGTPSRLPEPPGFETVRYLAEPGAKKRTEAALRRDSRRSPNHSGETLDLFGDAPDESVHMQVAGSREQVTGGREQVEGDASAAEPKRTPRGTRIPDDFAVTADMKTWFAENCPHVDGRTQHQMFVNYWRAKAGKDAVKVDWVLTWHNWMLKAEKDSPTAARSNGQRRSTTDDRVAQAVESGERVQAMLDARAAS